MAKTIRTALAVGAGAFVFIVAASVIHSAKTAPQVRSLAPAEVQRHKEPQVFFLDSGYQSKTTNAFTAPDTWLLQYEYDCSLLGQAGNFSVYLVDTDGLPKAVLVNQIKLKGKGITRVTGGGQVALNVLTECNWSVYAGSDGN